MCCGVLSLLCINRDSAPLRTHACAVEFTPHSSINDCCGKGKGSVYWPTLHHVHDVACICIMLYCDNTYSYTCLVSIHWTHCVTMCQLQWLRLHWNWRRACINRLWILTTRHIVSLDHPGKHYVLEFQTLDHNVQYHAFGNFLFLPLDKCVIVLLGWPAMYDICHMSIVYCCCIVHMSWQLTNSHVIFFVGWPQMYS